MKNSVDSQNAAEVTSAEEPAVLTQMAKTICGENLTTNQTPVCRLDF